MTNPPWPTKLNPRHVKVLDFYFGVSNFNKTDALRRAGYSVAQKSQALFAYPAVRKEIERREARSRAKYAVSFDKVQEEIAKVAFFNPLCILDIDDETGMVTVNVAKAQASEMAAISQIKVTESWEGKGDDAVRVTKVELKPWNKVAALESLMKHSGLSKEKSAFEGAGDLVDRILAGRRRASGSEE